MKKIIIYIIVAFVFMTTVQVNVFAAGTGPDAQYEKGMEYFEKNDYDSAFSYFQISGEIKGYAPSQNMLGICYRDGLGTEQDLYEAEKYFKLSAEQGYTPAQENLDALNEKRALEETKKREAYQDAMNLFFEGKYEEAKAAFEALGDYERSADFVEMCDKAIHAIDSVVKADNLEVGDYIRFGAYEQDNDIDNGEEPIEWLVLDVQDDKALLISKYGLDCKPYNNVYKSVSWEDCSLRAWLNNDFLRMAFSTEEQVYLLAMKLTADINPDYQTNPGNETIDTVFLLSIKEFNYYLTVDSERQCKPTAYAAVKGKDINGKGETCWWWLRTPGSNPNRVLYVNHSGSVLSEGNTVNRGYITIRPALWIKFGF